MHLTIHDQDKTTRTIGAASGQTLLDALRSAGETMLAPCGGAGTCGRCRILVRDAEGIDYRLACQTPATDGVEIIMEDIGAMRVEGAPASPARTENAEARSEDAEAQAHGGESPRKAPSPLGLAIDIGTTTMVFYLVDLDTRKVMGATGKVNPQAAFGADVIARINAASTPEGMRMLCGLLRTCIDQGRADLCRTFGADSSRIVRTALAGNTVMEHFAAGLDPSSIGVTPFTPRSLFGAELSLYSENEGASENAYFAPAVAGYVGGDITAGLHVSGMAQREEVQLFIDIGTNGEMALGNRTRMLCCATAAGPAFEGASITFGMPAMPGAIAQASLTEKGFDIETIDGKKPLGLCGSGLLDAVACLVEAGIVDETGYLSSKDEVEATFAHLIGEEHGQTVCYLDAERRVYLTQKDIRCVQLAKAAFRAGIETMMETYGVGCGDIDTVFLAGGFGMHMRPASAERIGLIPPALGNRITALGNAAGKGAVEALFDEGKQGIEQVATRCEYLELSCSPLFNERYIEAMEFGD
ncbi:ASKHA domain-containing protein [Raoultibacter phocaeensis]|uniref:ASKHA domain-containing protein n=1 Tax=Raoultibacter phocaeensis TaxID=2479841 RepID=UPI0015D62C31|nr:ASKHA domain-containing protein [Raoultibacter phocaeensis]